MEEEDIAVLDIDKNFEVYNILWEIEDLSLATCSKNWLIKSPQFTVRGLHTTKWLLFLTSTSDRRGDFMEFTLKRCDSDTGPERMWVEWRLGISVSDSASRIMEDRNCLFVNGTEEKEIFKNLKNSEEMMESSEYDSMTIRCRMIVFKEILPEEFEPCHDRGKRCLSKDLLNLFMRGYGCDLKLEIGNEAILAHKAIVFARIKKLDRLFEQRNRVTDTNVNKKIDVIDLSFLTYNGMMSIMKYIYSGDPWPVLGEPSLPIYDCVSYLEIVHLMKYYEEKKLTFRTSMNVREVRFTWIITDFHENYHDTVVSPVFFYDCSTTWQFHFFPAKERNYFSIFAEKVGETRLKYICLKFAVTDKSGDTLFARRLRSATDGVKTFGFDKFLRRSTLRSFSHNDILRLTIKLKLSTGTLRSCVEKSDFSVVTSFDKISSFDLLSTSMQKLFMKSDFSDVFIQNSNKESFAVHECIVALRWDFFSSQLKNVQDSFGDVITIPHQIESNILHMLLIYLYAGVLPEAKNRDEFTELRKAALSFGLPLLADLCSDALRNEESSLEAITANEEHHGTTSDAYIDIESK